MNTINIILHAHQPYVRHLEYEKFLEEDWLYEAINETYIPLLRMLSRLEDDRIPFRISMCFSPTLSTMLTDEPLQERFVSYMLRHIELGEKEVERTLTEDRECHRMAEHYLSETKRNLDVYEAYGRNILLAFKNLSEMGRIELVASAATHAFLPLFKEFPCAENAQVAVGVKTHRQIFGQDPAGFWLPEGGYYPGIDDFLTNNGMKWINCASHCPVTSPEKSLYGGFRPLHLPSGLYAFPGDWSLTSLIWSNKTGYPCDSDYREFYRDIGYYLPMEYVRPYMHEPALRVFTGYKYYAITSKDENKNFYSLEKAQEKASLHVDNFLYNIRKKGTLLDACGIKDHVFTLPFDAELFGHRWYEGIYFLEKLIRELASDAENYRMDYPSSIINTPGEYDNIPISESSWGRHGGADSWLDASNSFIYPHLFKAIERMHRLTERFPNQGTLKRRFLNQSLRELLLAMASDWPSIMHENTSVSYAKKRIEDHISSFNVVNVSMSRNTVNTEWLINAEKRNAIFPDIDYQDFCDPRVK